MEDLIRFIQNLNTGNSSEQPKFLLQKATSNLGNKNEFRNSENKNKLCIISTNKHTKTLSMAEDKFKNSEICHYLMPGYNINNLIIKLETKINNFTLEDFCIIMIGEEDFRTTKDYVHIVRNIREILQKIDYTNIILCSPTFKLGKFTDMFNGRIESFNETLYRDVEKYKYAYLMDSNLHLEYNYNMFNERTGSVDYRGMHTILDNVNEKITEIRSWGKDYTYESKQENRQNSNMFFR